MSSNKSSTREKDELAQLHRELRDVKKKCANLLEVNGRLGRRNDELEALRDTWIKREKELINGNTERLNKIEKEKSALIKEKTELTRSLREVEKEKSALNGKNAELTKRLDKTEKEKTELREKVQRKKKNWIQANRKLDAENTDLNKRITELENEEQRLKSEIARLNKENAKFREHIASLEKDAEGLREEKEREKTEFEDCITSLRQNIKELWEEKEKQRIDMKQRLDKSESENRKLKAQVCETSELISKQLSLLRESNELRFLRVQAIHCQELEALRESFREEMNLREEG
jgi:chromosome segregation ATPase